MDPSHHHPGSLRQAAGAFARYYANQYIFGLGDAYGYYLAGSAISEEFRNLVFGGPAFQLFVPDLTGTRFIRLLTALPYVVTGPTHPGGYVIFSFMSFWGLYLFYRAFCIAVPDGLRRRYAVLVFLLPSVVFWPSSIGKEAWLTTMLGIGAYGLARLLTQQRYAYILLLVSLAGAGIVRPHVGALLGAAAGAAFVLRRSTGQGATTKKVLGLLLLALVGAIVLSQVRSFFDIESAFDVQEVFDETARRSSQGGSQFETVQPTSISGLPWAAVTVLFRPFLIEAGSAGALVTALEGTVLLALFVWNLPRLARLPGLMISRPYVAFAAVYTLMFVFSFSAISNFGILARQRTQVFPIVIVLLSIPLEQRLRTRSELEAARTLPVEKSRAVDDDGKLIIRSTPKPADPRYRNLSYGSVHPNSRDEGSKPGQGERKRRPSGTEDPTRISQKTQARR